MSSTAEVIECELPRLMNDVTLALLGETGELSAPLRVRSL
jgi:hypothetical protein